MFLAKRGILANRFWMVSERMAFHDALIAFHKLSFEVGHFFRTSRSNSSHNSSIGLRFGDWDGQAIYLRSPEFSFSFMKLWHNLEVLGSLSCINIKPEPFKRSSLGIVLVSRIFLWSSFFIIPSIQTRSHSPTCEKHPQKFIEPHPCFTVGTTHSGSIFSSADRRTKTLLFCPNIWNLDSSVHKTLDQSSEVQFICLTPIQPF